VAVNGFQPDSSGLPAGLLGQRFERWFTTPELIYKCAL
jgi:hypothetical protein